MLYYYVTLIYKFIKWMIKLLNGKSYSDPYKYFIVINKDKVNLSVNKRTPLDPF